jgi:hypothetical protein
MRYAIIRGGEGLATIEVQRRRLDHIPFDVALEEDVVTRRGQRLLARQLQRLEPGDEVLLWSLDVLQLPTAELLTWLLRCFQLGVAVRLTGAAMIETLNPAGGTPRALSLLAEHEARRPSRAPAARRSRPSGRPLNPYQLKYARELLRRGTSLRSVGLLFQLAPDELSALLESERPARDNVVSISK